MTFKSEKPIVVAIQNSFHGVTLPVEVEPDAATATAMAVLTHIPLDGERPRAPRPISVPLLQALVDSGDAVFVDGCLLEAAAGRVARRRVEMEAEGIEAGARERAAFERFLLMLKSQDVRSAAAMLEKVGVPEPV